MLRISQREFESIRRHGEETYPHECCGVLLGQMDGDIRTYLHRSLWQHAHGFSREPLPYRPKELVRIQREGRARNEDIIALSFHPDHPARWSQTDLAEAHWLGCSYVITRVAQGKADITNSFGSPVPTNRIRRLWMSQSKWLAPRCRLGPLSATGAEEPKRRSPCISTPFMASSYAWLRSTFQPFAPVRRQAGCRGGQSGLDRRSAFRSGQPAP